MVIEYEGTKYVGWQVQPNGLSVQAVVERELNKLTGEEITVHASGRTDSGVHAYGQVAHFDTLSRIPSDKFSYALNAGLPRDIRIRLSAKAAPSFHSRFDVVKKHYLYIVHNAPHSSAFTNRTALHVHGPLDIRAMNAAAALFIGEHDFSAFHCARTSVSGCVRTIYESRWIKRGDYLIYEVAGTGFLYNMVRIMVGSMLEIGKGQSDLSAVSRPLTSGRRTDAGPTAPAHGLTLYRVQYVDFDTKNI